jgi:hypothetical protein
MGLRGFRKRTIPAGLILTRIALILFAVPNSRMETSRGAFDYDEFHCGKTNS